MNIQLLQNLVVAGGLMLVLYGADQLSRGKKIKRQEREVPESTEKAVFMGDR